MGMNREDTILDGKDLRGIYDQPTDIAVKKVLPQLDDHFRNYIELSPFLVLSTVRDDGYCDASPRGDAPGFVKVIDDKSIFLPDRPGNNRLDSMTNILKNPGIGMLFMIPGLEETLRINGTARIVSDVNLLASSMVRGKTPRSGLHISIHECYIHCGKALRRSKLRQMPGLFQPPQRRRGQRWGGQSPVSLRPLLPPLPQSASA